MACSYDNLSTVPDNIKMDGSYEVTGERTDGTGGVEINASALRIQSDSFGKSFKTAWRVIYVKIMPIDGFIQILKIERNERNDDNEGNITLMPNDGWDGIFQYDEKQTYYDGSMEREYNAVGHMTLTPSNGSSGDFGVIVYPIEAKFYLRFRYPIPLQQRPRRKRRGFGFFLPCFGNSMYYERLKSDQGTSSNQDYI